MLFRCAPDVVSVRPEAFLKSKCMTADRIQQRQDHQYQCKIGLISKQKSLHPVFRKLISCIHNVMVYGEPAVVVYDEPAVVLKCA